MFIQHALMLLKKMKRFHDESSRIIDVEIIKEEKESDFFLELEESLEETDK